MFGSIGGFELLVLMGIGLLVFGPRRLPEIGRSLGKALVEFRRAAMELRTSIEREINLEEVRDITRSVKQDLGEGLLKEAVPRLEEMIPAVELGPDQQERKGEDPGTGDVVKEA